MLSCFFPCLVIFDWLKGFVNFTFLAAGFFKIRNTVKLHFGTLLSYLEIVLSSLGLAF